MLCYHPVYSNILACGCIGGQIKVFDLKNNASQEWNSSNEYSFNQVISSLCFHPFQDILAVAINETVHFINWRSGDKDDFVSISTGEVKQKIRLVRFDCTGRLVIGISNDNSYLRFNNLFSNLNNISNLNSPTPTPNPTNNHSPASSNLDNLSNISLNNPFDRQTRNNLAFRIVDDYIQQNELNILRSESMFNLATNAITDSITQDHLLPDNLPSFAFLQRNHQSETASTNLYNQVIRFYRRLENEMNNDDESSNDSDSRSYVRRNNTSINNETNDEELNVIMESTNLVERFISRYRTLQDNENSSSETAPLNLNSLNMLPRRNRDYFLRRRLSSSRVTYTDLIEQRQNDRTNSDRINNELLNSRPTNERVNDNQIRNRINERSNLAFRQSLLDITSDTNPTQRNLSDQRERILQRIQQVRSRDNHYRSINQLRSNSLTNNNLPTSSSPSNESRNNTIDTSRFDLSSRDPRLPPANSTNQSQSTSNASTTNTSRIPTTSQDNHNRFYTLLQHQASRRSINHNNFPNLFSSTEQASLTNESNTSNMSILINRIQNSINAINRANSFLGSEEMQQLSNNGRTVLQRLIYYTNYRNKLILLKNRILLMLLENSGVSQVRIDLAQYLNLVSMLITFTVQMQRVLCQDLKFKIHLMSRLYLMRTTSTNNLGQSPNLIDIASNNDSNDSSTNSLSSNSNLPSTSSSSSSSSNEIDDPPIPSTSTGITKRKYSNDDARQCYNKKFKIPVVKIESVLNADSNSTVNNESNNTTTTTTTNTTSTEFDQTNSTNNRELLRTEMNSLLTNLEALTELLNTNQGRNSASIGSSSSSLNNLSFPIQRVNNPVYNASGSIGPASNYFNNTNNNANHFPASFNVFIPANQWMNYNEFNQNQFDNLTYRIQCFDFDRNELPNLSCRDSSNLVVSKCKIQNESSVDISRNGQLLCCLVPSSDGSSEVNLCVYSIKKSTLGQCLFIYCSFSSNAISVSFSPTSKYVCCGLTSRLYNYYSSSTNDEQIQIAQLFELNESLASTVKANDFEDYAGKVDESKLDDDKKVKHKAIELLPFKSIQTLRSDDLFSLTGIKWLPAKDGHCLILFYLDGSIIAYH